MQKTSGDFLKFWWNSGYWKSPKHFDFSTFKFRFLFWLSIAIQKKG
jgi:hypothetical protein